MDEYIKREDAIKAFEKYCVIAASNNEVATIVRSCILKLFEIIKEIPTADVISKDDLLKVLAEIDGNFKLKEDNNG